MKYCVKFKVEARYVVEVEADTLEEAKEKGENEFSGKILMGKL